MLGFLKSLLRSPLRASQQPLPEADTALAEEPSHYPPAASPRHDSHRKPVATQNGRGIEISVQNILACLPLELQPKVRLTDVGDLTITVPLEKVLAQLSRGAVKISFGELRQAVPEVFTAENDRDRVLVPLPLGDILSRLNPNLITRRRVQRHIQVPTDIASPFDGRGEGLAFGSSGKTETAAAPVSRQTSVAAPGPAPSRSTLTSAPTPAAPSLNAAVPAPPVPLKMPAAPIEPKPARVASPAPVNLAPAQPIRMPAAPAPAPVKPPPPPLKVQAPTVPPGAPATQNHTQHLQRPPAPTSQNHTQHLQRPPAPAPQNHTQHSQRPAAAPSAPITPPEPIQMPRQAEKLAPQPARMAVPDARPQLTPASAPQPAPAKPGVPEEYIVLPLTSLADSWPEAIRKEIVELKLAEARVNLPMSLLDHALKQGRIAFSWKMLRSWIKPAVLPAVSAHDANVLELPLKVVAPQFLARQKAGAKPQQKVEIDQDIPNLFFGFPQPEPEVPVAQATARPSDTNFYVWDDAADRANVDESATKRGPGVATKFVEKYATPNEVVSRASALDGVAGVLIALPDGLMVANRLPPDVNADTLAAFLPQIFGKVSQSTKELRMGELNNLNFTVGNVPWKIFRVNAIFFAAFGRAGEPLPTAQLAALAAELDHKPK